MATENMADRMSKASAHPHTGSPKKGEKFRCEQCGMAIEVTADCKCEEEDHVQFRCCGQDMAKK